MKIPNSNMRNTYYLKADLRLRDNLEVGLNLDLSTNNMKNLPKGLKVNGFLNLKETKIKALPNDLNIKGKLYCNQLI